MPDLFKWFIDWNRENPKDIFGPAYIVGAVGGAVVVATLLVTWGYPFQTDERPDRTARDRHGGGQVSRRRAVG